MNNKKIYIITLTVVSICVALYMFNIIGQNLEEDIDKEEHISAETNIQMGDINAEMDTERDINLEADIDADEHISMETNIQTEGDLHAEMDIKDEDWIYTEQVISDFLHMNSIEFKEKYKKDDLNQSGVLYCGKESWKYDGNQVDAYQEEYYNVLNITAIRFFEKQPIPVYLNMNIGDYTAQYEEEIRIDYNTDYAVSIYCKPVEKDLPCIQEISFVKIELDAETAPKNLYQFIENDYYEVRESLASETWSLSPDGEKAACVSNGELPKHPSQVFICYKDNKPLTVFRETWELRIVGWIDNDHLVCDKMNISTPILVHLERNEIEEISEEREFDTDGAKYRILGSSLVAQDYYGEQLYQWEILERDGEIYVVEPD